MGEGHLVVFSPELSRNCGIEFQPRWGFNQHTIQSYDGDITPTCQQFGMGLPENRESVTTWVSMTHLWVDMLSWGHWCFNCVSLSSIQDCVKLKLHWHRGGLDTAKMTPSTLRIFEFGYPAWQTFTQNYGKSPRSTIFNGKIHYFYGASGASKTLPNPCPVRSLGFLCLFFFGEGWYAYILMYIIICIICPILIQDIPTS